MLAFNHFGPAYKSTYRHQIASIRCGVCAQSVPFYFLIFPAVMSKRAAASVWCAGQHLLWLSALIMLLKINYNKWMIISIVRSHWSFIKIELKTVTHIRLSRSTMLKQIVWLKLHMDYFSDEVLKSKFINCFQFQWQNTQIEREAREKDEHSKSYRCCLPSGKEHRNAILLMKYDGLCDEEKETSIIYPRNTDYYPLIDF